MSSVDPASKAPFALPMPSGFPFQTIQQIMFNEYRFNFTASEITAIVSFGARPLMEFVMPPVIAKSFAQALLQTVEQYEAATGTSVLTKEDLKIRIDNYSNDHVTNK
jgi:hypothetical protein